MLRLTRAVRILLISFLGCFILQQTVDRFLGGNLLAWLALVPEGAVLQFRFWQVATYSFLHGDVAHLFFNGLMLFFVGPEIESTWGSVRFLRFYFGSVVIAGVAFLLMQFAVAGQLHQPLVGASGGIYGLLTAYAVLFGERQILFMMMIPMKAKQFVWILAGMSFMTTVFSPGGSALTGVAHLGGMAGGFVLLLFEARFLRRRKAREAKKKSHLRLVVNNRRSSDNDWDDGPGGTPPTGSTGWN